ncbi:HlyD family type I secretion periplasmic adaptor subunit [Pacificitalea manganoxidans]|uniref:HlyD family type I secretion periplasmic adaptor subunit n=1 Tax=Pacificitalea manganoxidans TaxID=1411902 RepID=UPI001E5E19C7|nr:HlyD family type I secretion periplasmic adaptor subunit [Pacificitalea manganoxidans]MDR6307272.1 HlyD family secretion protein [Pacificitalea manganoxidans]
MTFSAKLPLWFGAIAVLLLVGGFGAWATFAQISGAIIAQGQVEVEQNQQIVQHPDGGVVQAVLIEEGARVTAGDVLLRLDGRDIRTELAIVEGQLFELMARAARLKAERDATPILWPDDLSAAAATRPEVAALRQGQARLFAARTDSLAREVAQMARREAQIGNQIEGIDAQIAALRDQEALVQEDLTDQQTLLERRLAQATRVRQLRRDQAALLGRIGELTAQRAQAQGRQTELQIEGLKLTTTRREEAITQLRDLRYNELELLERRRNLRTRLERLDLRAPVAGIVHGLTVTTPQAVLRPAEPVLYLVPQDRPLVIAARVEPIHVDQVGLGQEVILRFPAFDSRTTPELTGQVAKLSADSFTDDRSQAQYYRVEIQLAEAELARLAPRDVIPGMPVEAFLKTGARSPLDYLIKPLADYFNKAFREG